MLQGTAPTERFGDRVENYRRYRPSYPEDFWRWMADEIGAGQGCVVADIGAGTGISTEPLLRMGARVWAIEPNDAMRGAAVEQCGGLGEFHAVGATAEHTSLPDGSCDIILCAQAFHWFDRTAARHEFCRVLKPSGQIVLAWNRRHLGGTPFLDEYERLLLEFGTDYDAVRHDRIERGDIGAFLGENFEKREFDNGQSLDFDGLKGRLLSSSYVPGQSDPRRMPMLARLREIFDATREVGRVEMLYTTEVYAGRAPA